MPGEVNNKAEEEVWVLESTVDKASSHGGVAAKCSTQKLHNHIKVITKLQNNHHSELPEI